MNNKILAVSSPGGHWVQLCRLMPSFTDSSVTYVGIYAKPSELKCEKYYQIGDVSRDTFIKVPKVMFDIIRILHIEKPDYVITTGALPGLLTILIARLFRIKTIWLDSIANSETVSASGRIASFVAHDCYTQWEDLTNTRIKYIGRVV